MMITEFSDAIATIIQHQKTLFGESKNLFTLYRSQSELIHSIFTIKQTILANPCCGKYYYYWLAEGYYQLSWQFDFVRDQIKAVHLAKEKLVYNPYSGRGFDDNLMKEILLLESDITFKCLLKLCIIEFELEFFFLESGKIEDIDMKVKKSFSTILDNFEKYEIMVKTFIHDLELRVFDLLMKSNIVFLKRAIHLLIGLTLLLVSKTSCDTTACNLVLNLFNIFIPLDSNVNIDSEFNFTVNLCLDKYHDRFREIFHSKYSRNGIHGVFFVRILKIYDSNSKFEIILLDLLNDEKLKIYNRKPLLDYLEDKLKFPDKKVHFHFINYKHEMYKLI
jgi:hypothetical protein